MAKGIKSKTRTVAIANAASVASGSNLIFTQADMGTTRNALAIVNFTKVGINSLLDFHIASSYATGIPATAAEVASDNNQIVQDTVNSTAATTVTSKVCDIAATGIYVYNVHDLRRYANAQYTSASDVSSVTINLVGLDQEQAPYSTATTGY